MAATNISPRTTVVIADDVLSANLDPDEQILLDINSGIYFALEGSGAYLWNFWKTNGSLSASIDGLVATYEVDHATATSDVLELVDSLVAKGLASVVENK